MGSWPSPSPGKRKPQVVSHPTFLQTFPLLWDGKGLDRLEEKKLCKSSRNYRIAKMLCEPMQRSRALLRPHLPAQNMYRTLWQKATFSSSLDTASLSELLTNFRCTQLNSWKFRVRMRMFDSKAQIVYASSIQSAVDKTASPL